MNFYLLIYSSVTLLLLQHTVCIARSSVDDVANANDDEEIAEQGYTKVQSELQKAVLKGYDKKRRPVLYQYTPTYVNAFVHLTHISVDQREQTLTLAGIITMRWADEYAVWDPSKYYGIKKLTLNQWEIWVPDIRVTNSVAGLGQFFEISRRSHVTLESINPYRSYATVRPKFNIRIGCKFDYSSYPNDVQQCAMGLFTIQRMSDVQLFYAFEPSVLLVELKLVRHAPYYMTAMFLPAVISFVVVITSFFLPSPASAIYVLLANFFLIDLFLEDLLALLPPVIGSLPRIVRYTGLVIVLTTISIFLNYWFYNLLNLKTTATGFVKNLARLKSLLPRRLQDVASRTYQQNQTVLHRLMLKNYNRDERPVRNQNQILIIQMYPHVTHISIDQSEQTVMLNGIMHMKWKDENATWEPSERNGVRVTNLKQWEIWHPEIMYSEKRTRTQATEYTEVYSYPRFSIKVGCRFDYSAYPKDIQKCIVEWRNYSSKSLISDWKIVQIHSYSSFYAGYYGTDNTNQMASAVDFETAVSMMHTEIILQRYAPYYGLAVILPAFVSFLFLISSYLLPNPSSAVYLLIANFFLIGIFIGDIIHLLPPAIGSLPKIDSL
ncbi:unnamed protein product [Enterobius vermicularis]|uniref:Neur_chan_LBD domain-containing protein n=1 Tax=Enterobius vermicularis TaxID=51028 RepID=A0A0N4V0A5_ENTVE|nr:unnamed protein product [Enterobius vermicularis]